jgi:hypothetical protein
VTGPYVGVPINALPLATDITGSEMVPILQSGQTRRTTAGLIAAGPSAGGTVQQISTGNGLSGGANGITVSGKIELAQIPGPTLLGNPATSTGYPTTILLGSGLSFSGNVLTASSSGGGAGTITAVNLSMPTIFTVAGSPITGGSGTFAVTFTTQTANTFFAGPTGGAAATPTFRTITNLDLPFPTTVSIGGVQAVTAVASNWIRGITQTGVPQLSQPAFTDISGTISTAQIPALAYVASIATSTGLTGGTITNTGTISFAAIAPSSLWANNSTATSVPAIVTLGGGLAFSGTTIINTSGAADGVTSIVFQSGLSGGTITSTGTVGISNNSIISAMISANAVLTAAISNNQVTYAKVQLIEPSSLLGNISTATNTVAAITLAGNLAFSGTTLTTTNLTTGTVGSVATGTGLTGGTITNTGSISFASIATKAFWANVSTATAVPVVTTLAGSLAFSGTTLTTTNLTTGTVGSIVFQSGLSGATITNTGTVGISNSAITSAMISANAIQTANISGNQVTYAKIQLIEPSSILGNVSTASNTVAAVTLGAGLAFSGTTIINTGSGVGTVTQISTGTGMTGDRLQAAAPSLFHGPASASSLPK